MDSAEFEALGVYDPKGDHAELRLELLEYLTALGGTAEELVQYRDSLPGLALVLAARGGPGVSIEEISERTGVGVDDLRRLIRASGFADPQPGARIFSEDLVDLASSMRAVAAIFGEDTFYQLARVIGSSMARIADAIVSAFLVNVEPTARRQDPVGLAVARANVEAAALLPIVPPLLDVLLRQHLLAAQRTVVSEEALVGYETRQLAVGFMDLVGSTELAERLGVGELGAVLTTFENVASDAITEAGGRVVKLIGDEVMFTATDVAVACRVALDLAETFRDHPDVPPIRAGLACGAVMLRDGDAFGPVVNVAARTVKVSEPSEVIATPEVIASTGWPSEPLGPHRFKGLTEEIQLYRLLAAE